MSAEIALAAASVSSNVCQGVDMYKHCACRRAIAAPSRRFVLASLAAATVPAGAHAQAGGSASAEDTRFMRMALDEARRGDFPFGAVIVRDGSVIARGRNLGRTTDDPTAHGEMVAIRRCLADHGSASLRGSTLYTSGEPCAMRANTPRGAQSCARAAARATSAAYRKLRALGLTGHRICIPGIERQEYPHLLTSLELTRLNKLITDGPKGIIHLL